MRRPAQFPFIAQQPNNSMFDKTVTSLCISIATFRLHSLFYVQFDDKLIPFNDYNAPASLVAQLTYEAYATTSSSAFVSSAWPVPESCPFDANPAAEKRKVASSQEVSSSQDQNEDQSTRAEAPPQPPDFICPDKISVFDILFCDGCGGGVNAGEIKNGWRSATCAGVCLLNLLLVAFRLPAILGE